MNKSFSENTKLIAGLLLFFATTLLVASWYIKDQQSEYRSELKVVMAEQETKMTSLAELADRDGVDSVVNQLVKDCAVNERERFDSLLGSLSELDRAELLEVERLFGVCGGYYAERRAILIARLKREYEVYQQYTELFMLTGADTSLYDSKLSTWGELVNAEEQRSQFSSDLVNIQEDIITELIAGSGVNSDEITEDLKNAQGIKDSLLYLNITIDELRSELSGI